MSSRRCGGHPCWASVYGNGPIPFEYTNLTWIYRSSQEVMGTVKPQRLERMGGAVQFSQGRYYSVLFHHFLTFRNTTHS